MQRPTRLGKYVDLTNPIEVEEYIYALDRKNIYKNKPFQGYRYFCEANTIHYKKPKTLHEEQFLINPPTRARLERLGFKMTRRDFKREPVRSLFWGLCLLLLSSLIAIAIQTRLSGLEPFLAFIVLFVAYLVVTQT